MNKDQRLLEEAYQLVLEYSKENFANKGIVFLTTSNKDIGCCIGTDHVGKIEVSKDLIERIKRISNLKFYAEGIAAKHPEAEPGMMPFLNSNFEGATIEKNSWDEIIESKGKGTANPNNNIYWMFANHKENHLFETRYVNNREGNILDVLANAKSFPKNVPADLEERKRWIALHLTKAGFGERLKQKFEEGSFLKFMRDVEYSVYPGQQHPDLSTYLGKQVHEAELERNQTIYDLMKQGGCCFAGSGHLIELKQQFPNLELIGEENTYQRPEIA